MHKGCIRDCPATNTGHPSGYRVSSADLILPENGQAFQGLNCQLKNVASLTANAAVTTTGTGFNATQNSYAWHSWQSQGANAAITGGYEVTGASIPSGGAPFNGGNGNGAGPGAGGPGGAGSCGGGGGCGG